MEEVFEWKRLRYAEVVADVQQWGWRVKVCPVEVGCREFVATSTSRLLREIRVRGKAHQQAVKDLSRAAEKGNQWLWMTKRPHLGSRVSRWHLGGESWTLGFIAEPSGGVVGLSVKHPRKRAPT